jgi:thiol-disulfide isomerase/thioredoxin
MAGVFWYTDWKYNLPTPVPTQYHPVQKGEYVALNKILNTGLKKPVFIHFFNPDCPCSRFNMPYFKTLVKEYNNKITFAIVVLSNNKKHTVENIQQKFDLNIPVLFDSSLAGACGVYSTPQAVLLDENHHLYYRGNYNKSRYCTDKKTNYAQMAIDSLLCTGTYPVFKNDALIAYGCQLPACSK